MQSGLSQTQEQALVRSAPDTKEIPYDYVAKFKLQGNTPGNRVQDVINISTDGSFVAMAIGYSFIPAKLPPITEGGILALPSRPADGIGWLIDNLMLPVVSDPRMLAQCLLVQWCGIDFKYSIVDSGSGRELQNQPIHNIAGLGESTGDRPFRPFAKPMLFLPRSAIRIEVEEISEGPIYTGAELFIVLHGYKILGYGTAMP